VSQIKGGFIHIGSQHIHRYCTVVTATLILRYRVDPGAHEDDGLNGTVECKRAQVVGVELWL
jgi:hypothetical protein